MTLAGQCECHLSRRLGGRWDKCSRFLLLQADPEQSLGLVWSESFPPYFFFFCGRTGKEKATCCCTCLCPQNHCFTHRALRVMDCFFWPFFMLCARGTAAERLSHRLPASRGSFEAALNICCNTNAAAALSKGLVSGCSGMLLMQHFSSVLLRVVHRESYFHFTTAKQCNRLAWGCTTSCWQSWFLKREELYLEHITNVTFIPLD